MQWKPHFVKNQVRGHFSINRFHRPPGAIFGGFRNFPETSIYLRSLENCQKTQSYNKISGKSICQTKHITSLEFLIIFLYFLWFFEFFFNFSEKITQFFNHFHSQILLYDCVFWQFSIDLRHIEVYGKLRNPQKIAPGGLCKYLIEKWTLTWFLTKWGFHCITLLLCLQMAPNASKLNKYYPFWVRTHFGYF